MQRERNRVCIWKFLRIEKGKRIELCGRWNGNLAPAIQIGNYGLDE
jgi:hypothetical protein